MSTQTNIEWTNVTVAAQGPRNDQETALHNHFTDAAQGSNSVSNRCDYGVFLLNQGQTTFSGRDLRKPLIFGFFMVVSA